MKILARIGAIFSATSFLIPAVWLLNHANAKDEPFSVILGFTFLGVAFFAGTILWVVGEKCCSKQNSK